MKTNLKHPLRVAVDCRLMYYRRAGIAQYTRRLVQALAQNTPEEPAMLSVLLDRRDADTTWIPAGVRVRRVRTPAHHRLEQMTLPLELALAHIDVLHSTDFIAPRGRFKKVITIHDLYFMEHPEVMSPAGARYYGQVSLSVRRADHIIAVSDYTRREIVRLLPGVSEQQVSTIYEGAEDPQRPLSECPSAGADMQWPTENIKNKLQNMHYALFVGTFEPRKNVPTLLEAMKELPAAMNLVIVGERGWGNQKLAKLVSELGVKDRVIFAGRLTDSELDAAYRGARLLVFPSLSEGFGLPVLEAMSRGTPVVCSNAGALPEVAGDAALLHDPQDVAGLARVMRMMWSIDPVNADYARRGKERAAQFTWARAAQQTWEVYRACKA
jgi:glycosyltransferase involved in cell wall biosynthesis